jgi:hypothetical protein
MIKSIMKLFFPSLNEPPERARDRDAAVPPTINEVPAKKKAVAKKAAPKKRGRPKGSRTKKK